MKNITGLVIFAAGAGIGSVVTWYLVKDKYEKLAQEEIDSVKEVFYERRGEKVEKAVEKIEDARTNNEGLSVREYAAKLSENGYTDYTDIPDEKEVEPTMGVEKPYVIPPEEFGELDDYGRISLTFYADHILADDNDNVLEDVEEVIGSESLNHFGEYEDDSVFVRNDKLKLDYEILLDVRKYSDVLHSKPYLAEV